MGWVEDWMVLGGHDRSSTYSDYDAMIIIYSCHYYYYSYNRLYCTILSFVRFIPPLIISVYHSLLTCFPHSVTLSHLFSHPRASSLTTTMCWPTPTGHRKSIDAFTTAWPTVLSASKYTCTLRLKSWYLCVSSCSGVCVGLLHKGSY